MRTYQVRRSRPTLSTAHDFFRSGGFSIDPALHYLSGAESEAELEKVSEELENITKQHFPRTQNLEYALLKCHLIVEHALVQFIRCHSSVFVEAKDLRFTFSQKMEIAYLFGFGAQDPTLFPTVEQINKVRNQVAHSFVLDREAVDQLLRINSEEYDEFKMKSDRERVRRLRYLCEYICGRTAGQIIVAYTIAKGEEERAKKARAIRPRPPGASQDA